MTRVCYITDGVIAWLAKNMREFILGATILEERCVLCSLPFYQELARSGLTVSPGRV